MDSLEGDVKGSEGGEVVLDTEIVGVDPAEGEDGWVVQTVTGGAEKETDAILAKTLINAPGLSSHQIINRLFAKMDPPQQPVRSTLTTKSSNPPFPGGLNFGLIPT